MFPRPLSMRSATLLAAASMLLVACAGGVSPSSPAGGKATAESSRPAETTGKVNTVLISQFKYQPETLTVNAGETVEWKNEDIVPHTATAVDGKAFDSHSIAKGASWRFKAAKAGTYDYLCTLHPNMKARLIVR